MSCHFYFTCTFKVACRMIFRAEREYTLLGMGKTMILKMTDWSNFENVLHKNIFEQDSFI